MKKLKLVCLTPILEASRRLDNSLGPHKVSKVSLNSVVEAFRFSIHPPSKTSFVLPSTTSRCSTLAVGWDVESSTIQEDSLKGSRRVEWIVGAAVGGYGGGRWVHCSNGRVLAIHCRCFSRLKNIVYDASVNLRERMVYGLRYGLYTEKRPRLTKTIQGLDGASVSLNAS